MVGIYKITSPSGKIYIGQSWDIKRRFRNYKNLVCKNQKKVYASLQKYGVENHIFEIICELSNTISQEELNIKEIEWWKFYKDKGTELMNIKEPGSNGKLSEDTIEKLRQINTGKKLSEEQKQKIKNSLIGKKRSPEIGKKISESLIGKTLGISRSPRSEETKQKISSKLKGNKLSEEAKKKIKEFHNRPEQIEKSRNRNSGKKLTEAAKLKMSQTTKGVPKKKIECPYCGKIGAIAGIKRYHFDNCKNKI